MYVVACTEWHYVAENDGVGRCIEEPEFAVIARVGPCCILKDDRDAVRRKLDTAILLFVQLEAEHRVVDIVTPPLIREKRADLKVEELEADEGLCEARNCGEAEEG
jgi:hypothetical protein